MDGRQFANFEFEARPVPTQGMRLSLNRMSVSGGETSVRSRC